MYEVPCVAYSSELVYLSNGAVLEHWYDLDDNEACSGTIGGCKIYTRLIVGNVKSGDGCKGKAPRAQKHGNQ